MRVFHRALAVSAISLSLLGGAAVAQDHHDDQEHHDQNVRHDDWKKGEHMRHEDWDRGRRVDDWQARHLHRPANGQEWRDIDGHYILASNDGVIFEVVEHH